MRLVSPRWLGALAATAVLSVSGALSGATLADDAAETFVAENASKALTILADTSIELEDKEIAFRTLIDEITDVPKITRFVLGRYRRGADEAEMAEFAEVFRRYAIGVYEDRLGDYAGETLTVTGSTDRRPGDTIVHTEITGGSQDDALPINWRVLTDDDGVQKVIDVEVYGVWLAINQREEIVGIIQDHRGRIPAASQALRAKLDELDASG